MASLNISLRLFKFIKTVQFLPKIVSDLRLSSIKNTNKTFTIKNVRMFSKNPFATPEEVRKKTVKIPKVLLLSQDGKVMEEITLEAAQNMAKRRNLNLIQVVDLSLKTVLPTYQLMSKTQFVEEDIKAKKQKNLEKSKIAKVTKLIIISSKIDSHDLEIKINKIVKLLKKNHKVQVFVSTDGNKTAADTIIQKIERNITEGGKLLRKIPKVSGMKLYFDPHSVESKEEKVSE